MPKAPKTAILMDSNGKFLNHREVFPDTVLEDHHRLCDADQRNIAHHPTLTHEHLHDHVHLVRGQRLDIRRGPERSNSQRRTFSSTSHKRTTTTPRGKTAHAPPAKREESPAYQNPTQ
ncbi:hypothetical protein AAFF_G00044880 [Aldrovandia affinis]|uniref:Uncharacterized protein n=1 Tax=Aldrovandia affinis TaxID=143900 RepID=A0AAD7R1X8_9TELE|nr:hypothetical protein AAFF_G00044880 [Aldrovandia affinis]